MGARAGTARSRDASDECQMSSPVSSCHRFVFGEEPLEGPVPLRVVGDAFVPTVPDEMQPTPGEDADRVRVVFASGYRVVANPGGPGVVVAEPPAKSQTALRSCLLRAQRKVTGPVLAGLAGGRRP
jgi:hypothetical protein